MWGKQLSKSTEAALPSVLYDDFSLRMVRISYPSPRVSQLDAHILDSELSSLLKQQLVSIFQLHTTSWWTYNQHPEFWTLLLNLLVFRLTVWKNGSSYGLSLQNLKLANFKNGKLIGYNKRSLLCAILVGEYIFQKFESYLYSKDEAEISATRSKGILQRALNFLVKNRDKLLTKINETLKIVNLLNFILFLVNGKFPTVVHRLLGISLTPVVTDLLKFNGDNVNFEFQNRQLVWNVMTEFLVFILPLLKLKSMRRRFNRLVSGGKKELNYGNESKITPYTNLPISQCAICIENSVKERSRPSTATDGLFPITNPYITNCGHIYCYVCISTRFNAMEISDGENDICLRCSKKLESFREFDDIDKTAIIVDYVEEEPAKANFSEKDSLQKVPESEYEDSDDQGDDDNDEEKIVSEIEYDSEENDIHDDEENSFSEGEEFDEDEAFEL
ncbi:hypothetical protein CLIB1423_44S00122 [[Candida] railenensis]|uniref:RING-type domain-containing protein n=1 Tax=[Candida] railenensis TaxID=45579 RepID=A0A9P0W1H8_9ASCO|nr:hypothetical protein CLIB1423_44S00122 [[Candida] railenensis]